MTPRKVLPFALRVALLGLVLAAARFVGDDASSVSA